MLEILQVHKPLAEVADELINTSLYASRVLLPILLLIVLAYSLIRSLAGGETVRLDFGPVIRGLILMLVISVYPELIQMLSLALSGFTELFNLEDEQLAEIFTSLAEQAAGTSEESEGAIGAISSWFSDVLDGTRMISWSLSGWIQEGLIFAIRGGISLIRSFLLVFLYLIGCIAIAISIIPGFQQSALNWLKGFIGVSLWNLTLNILDMLVAAYNQYGMELLEQGGEFSVAYGVMVNIVIALVYLMTPALTNYFITTGSPASLLGQVFTAGAASVMAGGYVTRIGSRMGGRGIKRAYQARKNSTGREASS